MYQNFPLHNVHDRNCDGIFSLNKVSTQRRIQENNLFKNIYACEFYFRIVVPSGFLKVSKSENTFIINTIKIICSIDLNLNTKKKKYIYNCI